MLDGKIYAIGGIESKREVFDPSNGSWSAGVALPSIVWNGSAITVDGKIYLLVARMEVDIWTKCCVLILPPINGYANMPTLGIWNEVVWYKERFGQLVAMDGAQSFLNYESYDPDSDSWQTEANLIVERSWPSAWIANGRIYVAGGKNSLALIKFH